MSNMYHNITEVAKVVELEKEFLEFLTKTIDIDSLKLLHITRHLVNLRAEVRNTLATSESDILKFIERHKEIFKVNNGFITLVHHSMRDEDYDSDIKREEGSLPNVISNGIGVIVKLHATWGIISVKDPIKTSTYFSAKHFLLGYKEKVNLASCGLNIGTMVKFHAVREKKENFTTEYHATKVWKKEEADKENNVVHIPRRSCKTGLYDPVYLDGEGEILRTFLDFGFIAINGDKNNTVYFCKSNIVNYDNITNLNKLFKKGDLVEFSAQRASRQDTRARWVALKVWNKSCKAIPIKKHYATPKSVSNITSGNQSVSQSESSSSFAHLTDNIKQEGTEKEMIHDQSGKICPRSNGAVIKFGENLSQLADGDSSVYYISGSEVTEISWEFSEGEDVKFDAVKIKSAPGWKAILVWKGDKPDIVLPTSLGDFTAFTDDEDDYEIPEDISPSVLGSLTSPSVLDSHLSLNSQASEKSVSMKSELSHSKSVRSSEVTSKLHVQTSTNITSNDKIYKRPNLPPFHSHLQSNLSLSRESIISDKSEYEKSNRNEFNNTARKSVMSLQDITKQENCRPSISTFKDECLTDAQDSKFKSISEYSCFSIDVNDETKAQHSNHVIVESSSESKVADSLKNVGISDCKDAEIKETDNIKKFQDITGKIIKIYPKYARIKISAVPNPFTFYLRNFYCEKKSVEDIKDLKRVLKVGDTVHFNYFEIVDDFGQTWNKVSLVWSGSKPLCYNERTISDIMQQNNLSVTLKNESNNVQPEQHEETDEKSVTTVDESSSFEDKADECVSQTESCSDVGGDDCTNTFHSSLSSETPDVEEKPLDEKIKMFSDMISQKVMMSKGLLWDSKSDLNSLSAEITNLALEQLNSKKSTDGVLNTSMTTEYSANETPDTACSCGKEMAEKCNQTDIAKDTEIRTTFTAQNIFNVIMLTVLSFLLLKNFCED